MRLTTAINHTPNAEDEDISYEYNEQTILYYEEVRGEYFETTKISFIGKVEDIFDEYNIGLGTLEKELMLAKKVKQLEQYTGYNIDALLLLAKYYKEQKINICRKLTKQMNENNQ